MVPTRTYRFHIQLIGTKAVPEGATMRMVVRFHFPVMYRELDGQSRDGLGGDSSIRDLLASLRALIRFQ